MSPERTSNYEKTRDAMEKRFLEYDQERMIRKFGLACDERYFYIPFVGREYRLDRKTGRIEYETEGAEDGMEQGQEQTSGRSYIHADFNVSMTIFDVLCDSKPDCHLAGTFISLNHLKNVVQNGSLTAKLFAEEARRFAGQGERLGRACQRLGGIPQKVGDVSYQLPLFDFLPVVLQFWDGDEEFDPVLKLMWDANILDYMRYETTFYAASHLLERLDE